MQYEAIILELLSRIKVLEEDVAQLKAALAQRTDQQGPAVSQAPENPASQSGPPRTRMTDAMLDTCYAYGKQAYLDSSADMGSYADRVAQETGMNRSTAIIYLYAVRAMLSGMVFKRAISNKAIERYLTTIYGEQGPAGLRTALRSVQAYVNYREEQNLPSQSITALCQRFQRQIR